MYISAVTLFVNDVDRAINFYTKKLGWNKTADAPMGDGTRWVTVAPPGAQTAFTLVKGSATRSSGKVGHNSGVIIGVDDVHQSRIEFKKIGIEFTEGPRDEPWGGWAMFQDSEGNVHGLHSPVAASVGNRKRG